MSPKTLSARPGAPLYETLKLARHVAYRNTDHAIAEIVDNSIDANASEVQIILVVQDVNHKSGRVTEQVKEIIIADNGCGMERDLLDNAITISGSGSAIQAGKIGRFGYGLIYSSIYTCNRLDIWSWINGGYGIKDSHHAYIDMNELEKTHANSHFYPTQNEPDTYIQDLVYSKASGSGTVVRWSQFNKISWKMAKTVIEKSSQVLGRLYRKKLGSSHQNTNIFFTVAKKNNDESIQIIVNNQSVEPNDPMYLLSPSSTPGFAREAMFEREKPGGNDIEKLSVQLPNEETSSLSISLSCVKKDSLFKNASDAKQAGARPWGRHAYENQGISLVREGRELCLLPQFCKATQDRWWGIELEFSKELDDFFGVTSDKQQATRFQDCITQYSNLLANKSSLDDYIESMKNQGTLEEQLIKLVDKLYGYRKYLLDKVLSFRASSKNSKEKKKEENLSSPEPTSIQDCAAAKASDARRKYLEQFPDNRPENEIQITEASDEQIKALKNELETELQDDPQNPDPEVKYQIDRLIALKRSYSFIQKTNEESTAFLIPKKLGLGTRICEINKSHPFYTEICQALDILTDENGGALDTMTSDEVKDALVKATTAIYIMFSTWAELELDQIGEARDRIKTIRQDWGKLAKIFLEDSGSTESEPGDALEQ